ncbi:MAG: S-layer homology domain-containing protein [Ruminococcaceae bacterium]|nr:S-layer homology domain-containing protein [Oscillospiraceae bacterium]
MGLVSGTSATKYSPAQTLTRAQVCTMMVRAMGLEKYAESYVNQSLFTDVKSGMWHAGYVNLAYREGIIKGYGNGKFGPDDTVTYGQFVTILLRLLGYTESDIGKIWPNDYIVFAADKELDEGTDLDANDALSRADAAILLYNTILTKAKGASVKFYTTLNGYASSAIAIILDNNDTTSKEGDLYALVIGASGVEMKYFEQKNRLADGFVGAFGELLFNPSGEVIGFISEDMDFLDIVVSKAKISGITDISGKTYKISSSTPVISDGSLYVYGETGYVKVNSHLNQSARFYTDDKGDVKYIYLTTGVSAKDTKVAVAALDTAALELEEKLGIKQKYYHVVKNGVQTTKDSLSKYDVAYFDEMTSTLRASDYRITGYISAAAPSVNAAASITVSGCEISVLECAHETLASFTLGDCVTLLLTDEGSVAAAYPADELNTEMFGVLSLDGNSVTLCHSGLVITPNDISANPALNGSLVKIDAFDQDRMDCIAVSKNVSKNDVIDIKANTLGGKKLAAGCAIYEWGGSGYVYSLEGELQKSSTDFSAIYHTDTIGAQYISYYHVNAIGEVDIIVLNDVTGNYYEYGKLSFYSDEEGVLSYKGITVTNDKYPKESTKYIYTLSGATSYGGIALGNYSKNYQKVASVAKLTEVKDLTADSFYLNSEDEWYVNLPKAKIPVSENVKVYIKPTDKWQSGEEGLLVALSSELKITVYYDRTVPSGAMVRIIVIE